MKDWDAFITKHGVAEYVRVRYLEPLANRLNEPKWYRDDLVENIRRFGPSKYVAGLRKRMTKFQGTGRPRLGPTHRPDAGGRGSTPSPEPHVQGGGSGSAPASRQIPEGHRVRPPEPHKFPCEDPYCDRCNEAIKRLFRDVGLLPSGKPRPGLMDYTVEPVIGRLKVPSRYRRDESDK